MRVDHEIVGVTRVQLDLAHEDVVINVLVGNHIELRFLTGSYHVKDRPILSHNAKPLAWRKADESLHLDEGDYVWIVPISDTELRLISDGHDVCCIFTDGSPAGVHLSF